MLRRLFAGIIKGLIIGALVAGLALKGLGIVVIAGWLGYLLAVLTGLVTGLFAGKPIWARGAKLEAGLKAIVGALLAVAGLFVLRRWANFEVDLSLLDAGKGLAGDLVLASVPLLSTVLALLFELDNTPSESSKEQSTATPAKKRIDAPQKSAALELDEIEEPETSARLSKRR